MRSSARKKQILFDQDILSVSKVLELIENIEMCPICECGLHFSSDQNVNDSRDMRLITVDRIEPEKGYVLSNIDFICLGCNMRKNNASLQDIKNIISYMKRCA